MLLCRFGWHRWSKWTLVDVSRTLPKSLSDWCVYAAVFRACIHCNLPELKELSSANYVWQRKETPASAQEAGGPQSTTDNEQETIDQ